ncbi:MAG: exonuclease SbcCD subunit D [Candidatus Nanopelagicales bacterium]|nr:exonuclease SbcCD subunit D [Candidatus Nanopelagicales bacterium]MCU0297506.1 exonuclease SbcCD subunit D [Candidatus Nanopelagicales bacterium]
MRFLHTSDWHLGRGLHGTALHSAQAAALSRIVEIAREERVDAVLIAGDVYDRSVPPLESVGLLNRTLSELAQIAPVILTPGNHDSATRLSFGAGLFRDCIHIRGCIDDVGTPVMLTDGHGDVAVYAFPYLDPDEARHRLADGEQPLTRSHQAVLSAAMDRVRDDLARRDGVRSVVVAHAFVVGSSGRESAEVSESERDITVGTVDCVGTDVFRGVDYVALGHLHGRQSPGSADDGPVVHYSGSPLRYSFSESNHIKGVTIVDVDAHGVVTLRTVDIEQPRAMARIQGPIADLLADDGPFAAHRDAWVQVTVTDPSRPSDMIARIRSVFAHCLVIRFEPNGQPVTMGQRGVAVTTMAPRDVLADFIEEMGGVAASDRELAALEPLLAQAFGGGHS